jgi:hypothetical protein
MWNIWRRQTYAGVWCRNLKEIGHFEKVGIDVRIKLK